MRGHDVQDGGARQGGLEVTGQAVEDLRPQVGEQGIPSLQAERRLLPGRQRVEEQRGGPSPGRRVDGDRIPVDAARREQGRRLLDREREVLVEDAGDA